MSASDPAVDETVNRIVPPSAVALIAPESRTFQEALNEALTALRAANPEQAVVACDELLSADAYPDAVRALRLRGQALEALGDVARATVDYERVLSISPNDTETALNYARALSRQGRKDEAALIAGQLLDWTPNEPEAHRIATEAGAIHAYDEPHSTGRLAAAYAQFSVGRRATAMNAVRKVLAHSPERVDAKLTWAEFLWRNGQRIQAAEQCQQILDDEPDCLLAHALLTQIWQGMSTLPQAHLRKVDQLDPDRRELQAVLGEQDFLAVREVPAVPQAVGFADEDVHDVSDDPDHEDFMDRLMADRGPVLPPPIAPQHTEDEDDAGPADEQEGRVADYAQLDWRQATPDAPMDEAVVTRPSWLSQVQANSRPRPEAEAVPVEPLVQDEDDVSVDVEADDADDANTDEETPELQWQPTVAPSTGQPTSAPTPDVDHDPGNWLEAARGAIAERMKGNSAESQARMVELSKRMDAAMSDLQALATSQPDQEWYTLLGMAYTIKGKIDEALAAHESGEA